MLASQQFCVKWNSYSSNLQNVFPRLLTSEHFVDITLACEGQMIKCHKVVLSACSTYFEKLLVQNPCQHPIIFMKDMKHWEVQALVDFMYKGEVNVSQDELNSLLVAAEALQIRGLCGSEHANRSSHDSSRQGQSNSSVGSRIPSVSLPHDTVLSGGATVGRESPPFKRRRPPNEEKEHCPSQGAAPRVSSVMSTTNSRGEVNSLSIPHVPSVDQTRTDSFNEDVEDLPDKKPIKQELDMEDSYLEADLDADGPDEDYGSLEHQEDSDSNNREDAPPHSPLDQPGPSGLGPPSNTPVDKAATGFRLPIDYKLLQDLSPAAIMCLNEEVLIQEILTTKGAINNPSACTSHSPSKLMNPYVQRLRQQLPCTAVKKNVGLVKKKGRRGRKPAYDGQEHLFRQAAQQVQDGVPVRSVVRAFNIPRTTLRRYMARIGLSAEQYLLKPKRIGDQVSS